ncbi:copper amine oxidase N-terminal domain-containing protein [Cohnella algarum]|uniref:copper amine oxidase N-terminal domain-containing protein n=1 Tax=Cohnella algarum TaxID=2044859 RepID=UPI001967DD0D|nr:copper amine oxidase N-terminal domain-containing protein [Cohnella algarum]MBN2980647.1 copper amine oxidase N-terminal domain-containing protein [Cohnella algarum]
MKKFKMMLATAMVGAMAVVTPFSAFAATASTTVSTIMAKMKFDGQELALPSGQAAFAHEQRVYIPLRFVAYALQKSVAWDNATKTVTVSEPSASEAAVLKQYLADAAAAAKMPAAMATTIKVTPTSAKLVFDGTAKQLPAGQQVFAKDGTIYVPVRFMSESVGTTINWDSATKTVSGESKAYREAQQGGSGTGGSGGNAGSGSTGGGSTGGSGGGTSGGSGGAGGGTGAQTQAEIEAAAYTKLTNLKTECKNTAVSLGAQYILESDPEKQAALIAQGEAKLASCTAQFESIVSDTEAQLKAGGFSTDILTTYRSEFESEINALRELAESLM